MSVRAISPAAAKKGAGKVLDGHHLRGPMKGKGVLMTRSQPWSRRSEALRVDCAVAGQSGR
jgi:hypothetical protein